MCHLWSSSLYDPDPIAKKRTCSTPSVPSPSMASPSLRCRLPLPVAVGEDKSIQGKTDQNLVGGWTTPLKNMSSSIGMMTFPTVSGKIIQSCSSHHQPDVLMFHEESRLQEILKTSSKTHKMGHEFKGHDSGTYQDLKDIGDGLSLGLLHSHPPVYKIKESQIKQSKPCTAVSMVFDCLRLCFPNKIVCISSLWLLKQSKTVET